MQAADDKREADVAQWRQRNQERQAKGMRPLPFEPSDGVAVEVPTEPVKLGDYMRKKAVASASPFKVTEV